MNTIQITPEKLDLWNACFSIRSLVQNNLFSKADFMADGKGSLLISAVESVYLTDGMLTTFLHNDPPEHDFARCLWLWGAIQALVVQQDAVIRLGKALGAGPKSESELIAQAPLVKKIRELRNRSVGHPTVDDHNRGTGRKYAFPAVHSGKQYSFLLLDENTDPPEFGRQDIDVEALITQQKDILSEIVIKWRMNLMNEENAFCERNRDPSLEGWLLSSTFAYHVSNLYLDLDKLHLESAKEIQSILHGAVDLFKRKGALRDTPADILDSMQYPISELIQYFSNRSHLTEADIPVFNGYLLAKFAELTVIAKEIDEQYKKTLQKNTTDNLTRSTLTDVRGTCTTIE